MKKIKKIISNTTYVLKKMWSEYKHAFYIDLLFDVFIALVQPILVILSANLITYMTTDMPDKFQRIVMVILLFVVTKILHGVIISLLNNNITPQLRNKSDQIVDKLFFRKYRSIDAENFDDGKFFDKYSFAIKNGPKTFRAMFSVPNNCLKAIISLSTSSLVISIFDPIVFLFVAASMIRNAVFEMWGTDITHERELAYSRFSREKSYIRRVFYQPEFFWI